jgi:transposase
MPKIITIQDSNITTINGKERALLRALEDTSVDSHQAIADKLGISAACACNWVNECSYEVSVRLASNKRANKKSNFHQLAERIRKHKERGLSNTKAYCLEGVTRYTFNRYIKELM